MICPSLMKVGPRSVRMRRSFSGETPRVIACLWRTAVISFSLSLYVPVSLPFDFLPAVLFFSFLSVGFPLPDSFFVPGLLLTSSYCHSLSRPCLFPLLKRQDSGTLSPHPAFINFFILFCNAVQDFLLHFLNKAILFLFRKMLLLIPEDRPRILPWLPQLLLPLPLLRQSPLRLRLSPASC